MASLMVDMHHRSEDVISNTCLGQQYILQKGLKVFKEKGVQATKKEADQLHGREAFAPIDVAEMTDIEREHACDAIMFLSEKCDKTVKGRMVFNGKPSREWHDKDDSGSIVTQSASGVRRICLEFLYSYIAATACS